MVTFAHQIGYHSPDLSSSASRHPPPRPPPTPIVATTLAELLQLPLGPLPPPPPLPHRRHLNPATTHLHSPCCIPSPTVMKRSPSSIMSSSSSSIRGHRLGSHLAQIHHTDDDKSNDPSSDSCSKLKHPSILMAAAAETDSATGNKTINQQKKKLRDIAPEVSTECLGSTGAARKHAMQMPKLSRIMGSCKEVDAEEAEVRGRKREARDGGGRGDRKEGYGGGGGAGEAMAEQEQVRRRRRVHIKEGEFGVAWKNSSTKCGCDIARGEEAGEATVSSLFLLDAGTHNLPCAHFVFLTTQHSPHIKEFPLGPFRIVCVSHSEVGIKFRHRLPHILYPGRHCLSISRLEVFAGFESLLRRQSRVSEAKAMSKDNRELTADVTAEWQIKAEDAAAARVANVADVEASVCDRVRRAFIFVAWEINAHDLIVDHSTNTLLEPHPVLAGLSKAMNDECQAMFDEGWTITIWDLQLNKLSISSELQN